jgi:hypothetical protein
VHPAACTPSPTLTPPPSPQALYTAGKNSVKSDGTVRTFKALATGNNAGEPFWDAYTAYFKTPAFVDQVSGGGP